MKRKKIKISSLVKLLQDEDSRTANFAMAEIISGDKNAETLLARLQESPKAVVRKAAHQMQSILKRRRERVSFLESVRMSRNSLMENLANVHVLWYDEDDVADAGPGAADLDLRPEQCHSALRHGAGRQGLAAGDAGRSAPGGGAERA